jgi:RNA polymerase sigma-70 factor (ECF subfamily)
MPDATQTSAARDELSLLRAISRGDEKAMEILYRTHADAIFKFAYRRLGENYEDSEEVVQDTFLSALDMVATFQGQSSVYTWLCGIARLRIIDQFRRQSRGKRAPRQSEVEMDEALPSESDLAALVADQIAAEAIVDRLTQVLTEDENEAFMMRHVDGFSTEEIATVLDRSLRATEGVLYRARQKLRAAVLDGRVEPKPK